MYTVEELRKYVTGQDAEKRYAPWRLSERFKFMKGITSYAKYNDPTYLGFIFLFDFDTSPLLGSEDTLGTAANYLKRTGQTSRLSYLNSFIKVLRDVNTNMPWYWQSIEGGPELWKWKGMADPYRGGDDAKVIVTTLESVDLIITMLMDLYRKAVYDYEYRRVVIPVNLRKFTVTIHVEEIRMFHFEKLTPVAKQALTQLNEKAPNDFTGKLLTKDDLYIEGNTPYVTFTLNFCEFLDDESGSILETLANTAPEMAKQKLVWKYEDVIETENFYPEFGKINGIDLMLVDRKYDGDDKGKWEKLGQDFLQNTAINAVNRAEELANALASRVLLGNVYGLNQTNVESALQQGAVLSLGPAIANAANNIAAAGKEPANFLGRIYNDVQSGISRSGGDLGNVFK